jgi:hypothetical protein
MRRGVWRRRLLRTSLAAVVLSALAIAAWLLLAVVPAYRDLWLVLIGVIAAGAVGAWRADIDAQGRTDEYVREFAMRRLEDTERFIEDGTNYTEAVSRAVELNMDLPTPPGRQLLASLPLVGDFPVIARWVAATHQPITASQWLSRSQIEELRNANTAVAESIHSQRMLLLEGRPMRMLTDEEEAALIKLTAPMASQPDAEHQATMNVRNSVKTSRRSAKCGDRRRR